MSALITLVIVVMWAAVLIPMWMRRHERASELTSVDRFAGAMRVLRRQATPDRRWVVMPARPDRGVRAGGSAGASRAGASRAGASRAGASPGVRVSPGVRRRRRTLLALTAFAVVTAIAAVELGGLVISVQVLADALLVAGLVRTRSMVTAERRRRVQRARRIAAAGREGHQAGGRERGSRESGARESMIPAAPAAHSAPTPGYRGAPSVHRPAAPPAPAPAAAVATAPVARAPHQPDQRPGHFPAAPAVLDLTRPGAWSEGRLLDDEPLLGDAAEPLLADLDEDDLDGILSGRRAVNG
ncbi:MAG: hypothetical protein ACYDB7_01295 [Mycobacteriales bacterium]